MNAQVILLEDGWIKLKSGGIQKIEHILEDMQDGIYKNRISTDEYSQLYTCVCIDSTPHPSAERPLACPWRWVASA